MKLKLAIATAALILSQSVMAQVAPQACPSVEQLAAEGVTMPHHFEQQDQNTWIGINPSSTFATSNSWTFVAGAVETDSQADAVKLVNEKLAGLSLVVGPQSADQQGHFMCLYASQDGKFGAAAITPVVDVEQIISVHKQFNFTLRGLRK